MARPRSRAPSEEPRVPTSGSNSALAAEADNLYAFHAPEVECIARGKARARYEFGVKTSFAVINAHGSGVQFVLGAQTLPGDPYDGNSLADQLDQVARLTGRPVRHAYAARGYRGHGLKREGLEVVVSHTRGVASPTFRREMRRRNAIEPVLGHMKSDSLLERNHLLRPRATPSTPSSAPSATTAGCCWWGSSASWRASSPTSPSAPANCCSPSSASKAASALAALRLREPQRFFTDD